MVDLVAVVAVAVLMPLEVLVLQGRETMEEVNGAMVAALVFQEHLQQPLARGCNLQSPELPCGTPEVERQHLEHQNHLVVAAIVIHRQAQIMRKMAHQIRAAALVRVGDCATVDPAAPASS
jgi:hypothetical protein